MILDETCRSAKLPAHSWRACAAAHRGEGREGEQPLVRQVARLEDLDQLQGHEHGNVYNRLLEDGELVLQLHSWDDEDHSNLVDADAAPLGHGVLLWFQADDFDAA
ncbi:MAG: hypothetical protein ABR583_07745, partial [Gaiellaceae bacterium]